MNLAGTTSSQTCMLGIREDPMHLVMQCSDIENIKGEMFEVLFAIDDDYVRRILQDLQNAFYIRMGKHPFESMVKVCLISSHYISRMYRRFI